jgi:hypothetical protein
MTTADVNGTSSPLPKIQGETPVYEIAKLTTPIISIFLEIWFMV